VKIGFVSLPFTGHVNPMTALARKIQSRGHEIAFIGFPDVGPTVRAAGLNFVSYGEQEFPEGSSAGSHARVSKLHGLDAIKSGMLTLSRAYFSAASEHLPGVLAENGIEALVLDMSHRYLELVPLSLACPMLTSGISCPSTHPESLQAALSRGPTRIAPKLAPRISKI
jgi:UDP:flavonoid glycosyltransferase YjiC (YdhE family)